jgi:hypothetical protein
MITRALNCVPGLPPSSPLDRAADGAPPSPSTSGRRRRSPSPPLPQRPSRLQLVAVVVSKTPLPPFTLPRAVALASARRRQPRHPLAVRAAVAARAASLSPYLSSPRSQLRVGQNRAENRAPELENERTPASLR